MNCWLDKAYLMALLVPRYICELLHVLCVCQIIHALCLSASLLLYKAYLMDFERGAMVWWVYSSCINLTASRVIGSNLRLGFSFFLSFAWVTRRKVAKKSREQDRARAWEGRRRKGGSGKEGKAGAARQASKSGEATRKAFSSFWRWLNG